MDLLLKAEVGGTYVTVGILDMELIEDVANHCRYVLVSKRLLIFSMPWNMTLITPYVIFFIFYPSVVIP